jgi:serine/threonine protein kinase
MAVRIEPHAEPIPGYRLIERLGVGGFGEVWKCEAPGGLFKAIKVVHGELGGSVDAVGDEDSRADQELKALKRVKTVHHPYILSLERFDIVDGQLMIVMELADRTLWDRFKECRNGGLPGIPRQELLGYMRETAEALDLMNDQFQLQHLDIKPQNLFLVFNHVKVADFGLVKDLGTKATATITGGVTPVYAAPETFDGWLSRFSDQYSLAIVYQELLTGQRPFVGSTMRQLVLQHLQGKPDLAPLPAADRTIVARALSKDPEARYPNCLDFIHQLLALSTAPALEPGSQALIQTAPGTPDHVDTPHTRDARAKGLGSPGVGEPANAPPQMLPPRPVEVMPVGIDMPARADEDTPPGMAAPSTVPAVRRNGEPGEAASFVPGPVQPSLIIGLGGIGVRALTAFRHRVTHEVAHAEDLPYVRLLGMDADADALYAAGCGEPGSTLTRNELMSSRLHRAGHYLRAGGSNPLTDSWLNAKLLFRIPRNQNSAGLRPLGRLAFVDNYRAIARRLDMELEACAKALLAPPTREALAPRGLTPRVYLAVCLAGNTGSGMFLDVAYAARDTLRRLGYPNAEIVGLFFVPTEDGTSRSALSNAYASLTEMGYFNRNPFHARYDSGEAQPKPILVHDDAAPFQRCVLFGLPRQSGAGAEEALAQVLSVAGDYLYRDVVTPLGKAADELRHRCLRQADMPSQAGPNFHVINVGRVTCPRQHILDEGSRRVSRRLVDSWMSKDARSVADELEQWADETWDALGLRSEAVIARVHDRCEKNLKQPATQLVTAITGPLAEALAPPADRPDASPALGPAVAALADLDRVLGVAEECRAANQPPPPPGILEVAVAEATRRVAESSEQRLAEQVVKLMEDPRYRLVGTEAALRRLAATAERALAAQETLAHELSDAATQFYQRAQKMLETPVTATASTNATMWRLTFTRRTPATTGATRAAELLDIVRQYAKARYHALVLAQINRLYVGLRGQLSDQLREVGFCRQRLLELSNLLERPQTAANFPDPPTRMLLPAGCEKPEDAVERIDQSLTRDDLLAFDQLMQPLLRGQYRGLISVCMGSSAMVRTLAPSMLRCAREFLESRLAGSNSVAEILLGPDDPDSDERADQAASELQTLYQRAVPRSGPMCPDVQMAVALVPDDVRGLELEQLVRDDLPDVEVVTANRPDEIVFYREHIYRAGTGTEQLGTTAEESYRQRLVADPMSVHTREDIIWQQAVAASY